MHAYMPKSATPVSAIRREMPPRSLSHSPHSIQSGQVSTSSGPLWWGATEGRNGGVDVNRCRDVQQNRFGVIHDVEQNPSFRSNSAISVRMMANATTAESMPKSSV